MRAHRFRTPLPHLSQLVLAWSLLAGCASDAGQQPLADEGVELPEGARMLASVALTDSHAVEFYDLGEGHTLVVEALNMDTADSPALTSELMQGQPLSGVYAQLAGATADPVAQRALADFELAHPALPSDSEEHSPTSEAPGAPVEPARTRDDALLDKDASSDAYFFSNNWCNRCMGIQGSKMSWMPQDRPVCTNAPEACVTGAAPYTRDLRSNNLKIAGYNQSSSGTGSIRMSLNDPCEHDSWWSRKFNVCTKGSSLVNFTMQPRTAYGFFTSTSSGSWSRKVSWSGPGDVGFMWDVY